MYGMSDARPALTKPSEGRVPTNLISCHQDDPGAHSCQGYGGDLANPGGPARDHNGLPPHEAPISAD